MADRVGEQFGKYRLGRLLGHGGFADVYLGDHIYLNSQAAIKVLHARVEGDDTPGFLNEARTVANLQHPHIVRVLDFDVTMQGDPFLVMEYAPNGSLRRRYTRGTRLPLDMIVSYTKQVAGALQYAHHQKLIHCDIKPENMLLSSNNEILLSDFGIAVIAHTSRSHNMQEISGTAAYMAPEQLQGKASPASDQYALGIVVYEWLTGSYPFHGTLTEIVTQHMLVPPRPLREILPTLPDEVEQVVSMALAKDPAHRFARIEAFANALEQASRPFIMQPSNDATFIVPGSTPSATIGTLPTQIASITGPTITPSQPNIVSNPSLPSYPTITPPSNPLVVAQIEPMPLEPGHTVKVAEYTEFAHREEEKKQSPLFSRRGLLIGMLGVATLTTGGALFALAEKAGILPHPAPVTQLTQQPTAPATAHAQTPVQQATATPSPTASPTPTQQPTTPPAIYTYVIYRGPANMYTVAWSQNGTWIASAGLGSNIEIWAATTGTNLLNPLNTGASIVYSVAWSPDNTRVVSGQKDGTIQIWDAASGNSLANWQGHSSQVNSVAWSPNGAYIVSGGGDKLAKVWDTNGNPIATYSGHEHYVNSVAWASNSATIVSGGGDATAQVWEAMTGNWINTYNQHTSDVVSLAWMPNGTRIASASDDTTVQVWEATTGQRYLNYTGHTDFVVAVAWSPDTSRVASGSRDTTVKVWGATTGTTLRTYNGHSNEVESVTWSPDSTKIASASDDGTVKVWQAT
ncbi:MAG TPA: serine/threonine-protein kinase [Ktedonobacteraceae bacterium]|nr:serine/threonine-protein kinase [Ktedonobacteraceae bacterium]